MPERGWFDRPETRYQGVQVQVILHPVRFSVQFKTSRSSNSSSTTMAPQSRGLPPSSSHQSHPLASSSSSSSSSSSDADSHSSSGSSEDHTRPFFHHSNSSFAPPFYNRPPTPLPPSPSLTSLLRPSFSTSRPSTPDSSDNETPNDTDAAARVPRASPKVPTYEYYGFVLYLLSSLVFRA